MSDEIKHEWSVSGRRSMTVSCTRAGARQIRRCAGSVPRLYFVAWGIARLDVLKGVLQYFAGCKLAEARPAARPQAQSDHGTGRGRRAVGITNRPPMPPNAHRDAATGPDLGKIVIRLPAPNRCAAGWRDPADLRTDARQRPEPSACEAPQARDGRRTPRRRRRRSPERRRVRAPRCGSPRRSRCLVSAPPVATGSPRRGTRVAPCETRPPPRRPGSRACAPRLGQRSRPIGATGRSDVIR